jgi:hypothetical protein
VTNSSNTGSGPADPRAQALRAAEERAQERAQLIERQSSSLHTPEERIRLWEKLHVLSLPRVSTHPLLSLIASQTALTLQQVQDEQRRRASSALEQR